MKLGLAVLAAALLAGSADARPPPGADPDSAISHWFESLKRPEPGAGGCCDKSDCRIPPVRQTANGWQFLATKKAFEISGDEQWHDIPASKWLPPQPNPMGEVVVCWIPTIGVLCAVHASGA